MDRCLQSLLASADPLEVRGVELPLHPKGAGKHPPISMDLGICGGCSRKECLQTWGIPV